MTRMPQTMTIMLNLYQYKEIGIRAQKKKYQGGWRGKPHLPLLKGGN